MANDVTLAISLFANRKDAEPEATTLTWSQLAQSLETPRAAPCTVADCQRSECKHKDGPSWSPALYEGNATRALVNVVAISVLVLDLDHVAPKDLGGVLAKLARYKRIVTSSHSDSVEDRCLRVPMALSRPVTGKEWPAFWPATIALLGVPADPQTKDASRLYYLPSRPSDAPYLFESHDGLPLDVDAIMATIPIAVPEVRTPFVMPDFLGAPSADAFEQAAQILAASWPKRERHPTGLALCGGLLRRGWPHDLVVEFLARVSELAQPGNADVEKRHSQARHTAEQLAAGNNVRGWPTVFEHVPEDAVIKACEILGFIPESDPGIMEIAKVVQAEADDQLNAMVVVPRPTPSVSRDAVKWKLKEAQKKLSRSPNATRMQEGHILGLLLKGEPLTTHVDDDKDAALRMALIAVATYAPPDAPVNYLVEILVASTRVATEDLVKMIEVARCMPTSVSTSAKPPADDLPIPDDDNQLRSQLIASKDGGIRASRAQIERILRFSSDTGGKLRWNELTKDIEVTDGRFRDVAAGCLDTAIGNWLETHWQCCTQSTGDVNQQMLYVTRTWHSYNPLVDELRSLSWDGTPRINRWLTTYCGVEDDWFVSQVGEMFLISAVARALDPGCKVDTVLILEGEQGKKKSSVFGVLGGAWFSDTPMVLGDKDSRLLAASKWIVELGELKSLLRDDEGSKGFLSQRKDDFRPPYGRRIEEFPRRCVFVGTTNDEEYLQDQTGNRRYWPVSVTGTIDLDGLRRMRGQLLAEAVYRYSSARLRPERADAECPGERWWFTYEEEVKARDIVAERRPEDTWVDIVRSWVARQGYCPAHGGVAPPIGTAGPKTCWTLAEVAQSALDMRADVLPRHAKQLGRVLKQAGLVSVRVLIDGARARRWVRPSPGPIVVADPTVTRIEATGN